MAIIMTAKEYLRRLQVLASEPSYYDNTPGQNLLFVHQGGVRSGDCSNTIKALLNGYDVTNKTPGYFQSYLGNTGDVTTEQLLALCSGVSSDFTKLKAGRPELLHMDGHVGTYLGKNVTINGNVYNVIECTAWTGDWGRTGIIYSYVDQYGQRLNHKGGYPCYSWTAHGLFTPWLDYTEKKEEEKSMFNDVPKTNKYYKYYKKMVDLGLMSKDKNGNFNPEKHIKRKHLAIILYRLIVLLNKKK